MQRWQRLETSLDSLQMRCWCLTSTRWVSVSLQMLLSISDIFNAHIRILHLYYGLFSGSIDTDFLHSTHPGYHMAREGTFATPAPHLLSGDIGTTPNIPHVGDSNPWRHWQDYEAWDEPSNGTFGISWFVSVFPPPYSFLALRLILMHVIANN